MDMNFIFSWSTRYLTSERSERVRYRVDHEKIKFISTRGHVISSIYLNPDLTHSDKDIVLFTSYNNKIVIIIFIAAFILQIYN